MNLTMNVRREITILRILRVPKSYLGKHAITSCLIVEGIGSTKGYF